MTMHRINRLEIEIEAGEVAVAEHLIARLSLLGERRMAPLIDRICGQICSQAASRGHARGGGPARPERSYRIERLELDLGPVAVEDFDEDFLRKLEAALRAALGGWLAEQRGPAGRGELDPERSSLELLGIFARTGNLPWWADRSDPELVARHVSALLAAAPRELVRLLGALANDSLALARIARHLDEGLLAAIAEQTHPGTGAELLAGARGLEGMLGSGPGLAGDAAPGRVMATSARGRLPAVQSSRTNSDPLHGDLPAHGSTAPERSAGGEGLPGEWQWSPAGAAVLPGGGAPGGPSEPAPGWPAPSAHQSWPPHPAAGASGQAAVQASVHASVQAARRRALDQLDELYVDDAGLVILWPFLDRLFVRTGVVDEQRRFAHERAPMQAIALLSWLAFEDPEPPEYRLPLAKLLCGLAPETNISDISDIADVGDIAERGRQRPLAPELLGECERLLCAVIAHAPILGDMPVATFRATFLTRAGVLTIRDGAWCLQVERHAHDLVLERFPWSWSWVRLPWMPHPLRVEW